MLDFAQPMHFGFSTVIATGGGIDVGFGEILDALVVDEGTDSILLYLENVGDARTFLSALRAAARVKPVVVLKAGRSLEARTADDVPGESSFEQLPIGADAVFDAALTRSGTVRAGNYTQLFAAARILSMGRRPRGNKLAIVSNGRGPGVLAADWVASTNAVLAQFTPETVRALAKVLPAEMDRANPVDVRGDATSERLASVVSTALADANTDAVLAIHVPRPIIDAVEAARAVAAIARHAEKPVLGAWLGALNRQSVDDALEAGGMANFFTPENAVDAFAFVAAYQRNQGWLLEVPSSHAQPDAPDHATAERVRERALAHGVDLLATAEANQLMNAFGVRPIPTFVAETLAEAKAAARKLGYPLQLTLDGAAPTIERSGVANSRALASAYGELLENAVSRPPARWTGSVIVQKSTPPGAGGEFSVILGTDRVFGPVIAIASRVGPQQSIKALMLPPLNRRLARDLLANAGITATCNELVDLLLRVSGIACALPWVRSLSFDRVVIAGAQLHIPIPRVFVDASRQPAPGYRHMAIHPYPVELESSMTLGDGSVLAVRPVRPEDADLERRFVASLSEQTRYFRFFYRMHELSPAMLARFTQVDYDRELALLALRADPEVAASESIVGIARFIAKADHESAEFAVVVSDAWQGRGVGAGLMRALIEAARRKGLRRLVGTVLRANPTMVRFSQRLGFTVADDPQDHELMIAEMQLT